MEQNKHDCCLPAANPGNNSVVLLFAEDSMPLGLECSDDLKTSSDNETCSLDDKYTNKPYPNTAIKIYEEIRPMLADDTFEAGRMCFTERYLEAKGYSISDIVEALAWVLYKDKQEHMKIGALHILGHLPGCCVIPNGVLAAISATRFNSKEVQERALMCFENWHLKENIEYMKQIRIEEPWLQEYFDGIIKMLEVEGE